MILLAWFNCMYFLLQEGLQSALVFEFFHVWKGLPLFPIFKQRCDNSSYSPGSPAQFSPWVLSCLKRSSSFPYIWKTVWQQLIFSWQYFCTTWRTWLLCTPAYLCNSNSCWRCLRVDCSSTHFSWKKAWSFTLQMQCLLCFRDLFFMCIIFSSAFIVVFLVLCSNRVTPFQLQLALLCFFLFLAHLENCHKA